MFWLENIVVKQYIFQKQVKPQQPFKYQFFAILNSYINQKYINFSLLSFLSFNSGALSKGLFCVLHMKYLKSRLKTFYVFIHFIVIEGYGQN